MAKIDAATQIEGTYPTMVGVTMATARLLGRTTASAGAAEEISVGSGLSLVAGVLDTGVGSGETTVSTTGNIDDLNFSNAALIRFTNASLTTLRGLQAGRAGQLVIIISLGAGHVNLAHQDTNSSAANRLINVATSAPTPLAAGKGVAVLQYDATTQRWRLIAHDQGAAITPAFSAGDFTGSGAMTWTVDSGDVNSCNYRLRGNVLVVSFTLGPTTVGGTVDSFLHLGNGAFGGFTPTFTERTVYIAAPAGTDQLAYGQTVASDTKYYFSSGTTGANWSLQTNNVYLAGQISFTVT